MSEASTEVTTETEVTDAATSETVIDASTEAEIAATEQITAIENNAPIAEINAAREKFTKANSKLINEYMTKLSNNKFTPEQSQSIMTDIANNILPPDATITEINEAITEMKIRHGETLKKFTEIQQATSKAVAKSLSQIFEVKGKSETLLQQRITKMNAKLANSEETITSEEITEIQQLMRESMTEMDSSNPDGKVKAEGKFGERTLMLLKALGLIGLIASPILLGFILSGEYSGCYQFQTGVDQKKLTCSPNYNNDNSNKCSCGSVKRDLKFATEDMCSGDNALYPYCACGKGILPTCSSDISAKGAISYNYQDIGPLEALGKGIGEIGKGILSELNIGDIGLYIKYFLIAIGIIFGIVITLNIFKYFLIKNKD